MYFLCFVGKNQINTDIIGQKQQKQQKNWLLKKKILIFPEKKSNF